MEKILYRMCAYTHSDQFGKITVDRGFVDLAVVTGRVLESFWVHPEPRHGGGITASDPLWKSGLLGKQRLRKSCCWQWWERLLGAADGEPIHWGVECDVSGMCPIVGKRFQKRGENYDLCLAEFSKLSADEQALYDCIEAPAHGPRGGGGSGPPPAERPSTGPFPPSLATRQLGGLRVHFDAAALKEYEADQLAYDEIFRHASDAHAGPLQRFGQCAIIVHGVGGLYQFGRDKKLREESVDLGDPERGIAWFGNLEYENGRVQESTLFIVNMPRAILGHPTVFVHELTHYFHSRVGFERTPALAAAFERTKAARPAIEQRYQSEYMSNPRQFEETFRNDREFFAYLMEAYHSRPPGWSNAGVVYEAPAFPRTQEALRQMDGELGLGIVDVLEETLELNGRILMDV